MKRRVKIIALPKARTGYQVQGSLANDVPAMGGADYDAYIGQPKAKINNTIKAVDNIDEANLEAEGGETAYGNLNGNGLPSQKKIVGKRHFEGGVPLNLPDGTFIFSDTNSMKIKNPDILKIFGKGGTKAYKPAELAKQYDIDKYTAILKDPNSDKIDKKTAEIMIRNYNMKLGALALAQESKKGFPQGIPGVASAYMEANKINPDSLLPPDMQGMLDKKGQEREEQSAQKDPQQTEQLVMEIQQALQQGAAPEEVVTQLLQSDVSPEDILEAFVQLGIPQEEIEPIITSVFAEMQESAQQQDAEQEMPNEAQEAPMGQEPPMEQQGPPMGPEGMMRYGGMRDLKRFLYGGQEYFDEGMEPEEDQVRWMPPAAYNLEGRYDGTQLKDMIPQEEMPEVPMAEYGMSMGAGMSQNYMGRKKDMVGSRPMFYEEGGYLPKAGNGIEIKRSELAGKTPEEIKEIYQDRWTTANRGKKTADQQQIYILEEDGRKTSVNAKRTTKKYEGDLAGFSNRQDIADQYETLMSTLGDDDVKKVFGEYTRKALADKTKYVGGSGHQYNTWSEKGYGDPSQLSDQEIFDYMDEHQRRNYKLYASGREASFYGDKNEKLRPLAGPDGFLERIKKLKKPDGSVYNEEEAKELHKKLETEAPTLTKARSLVGEKYNSEPNSPGYSDADRKAIYAMQGSFQGYDAMVNDYNAGKFDNNPALKRKMSSLVGKLERGANDEGYGSSGRISPIDGYDTDTTAGHLGAAGMLEFNEVPDNSCRCEDGSVKELVDGKCPCEEKKEETPAKKCKCRKSDTTVYEVVAPPDFPKTPCPCNKTQQVPIARNAPWWLQDTIKTAGAFGDLAGIKKHMPWEAPVMLEKPKPVFKSPEREMANASEQSKIAMDALGQFTGAQGLSSRASGINAQESANAANILQRYNNDNVGIAQNFEYKINDISNQENMLKQAAATRLYDKNTIVNQQFDNAKLAMRNNLRNQYTNAITNRWKTDALNQMYPQYEVDPSTGGRMYYDETAARTIGEGSGSSNTGNEYRSIYDYYKKDKNMNDSDAIKAADAEMKHRGLSSGSGTDKQGIVNAMYSKNGGVLKKGGYVYSDVIFPFLM
tara:strand:+ start:4123 stop:7425 length:3303 start_codon:yes stop_codon:yes gene_type:complete